MRGNSDKTKSKYMALSACSSGSDYSGGCCIRSIDTGYSDEFSEL